MTLAFEHGFNLDLILDIWIIQVEWPRTEHYPVLLIIFLEFFRVGTQVDCRRAPVGVEGLQLLRPVILPAVGVQRDLPKVQLLEKGVLF